MRRALSLLLLVASASVGATSVAWAATCETELPGLGVMLLEAPAHLADHPRARSVIFDELRPGATIERRVRFSNGHATDPLPLAIYATSAEVADGSFRVAEGAQDNELTGWMDLSRPQLDLAPCSHDEVTVTIAVPADADGGERYAMVAAEHRPEGDGVTVASRVGVRVYLQVAGPEPARTDLDIGDLTPGRDQQGRPTLTVELRNPGDRAVDVATEVELTDGPGGTRAGPFPGASSPTIAPGGRETVDMLLDEGLPDGPWTARVTARTGELERTAQARIDFTDAAPVAPADPSGLPWWLVPLALLVLVLATLLLLLAWRRRDDRPSGPTEDEPVRPAGDPSPAPESARVG